MSNNIEEASMAMVTVFSRKKSDLSIWWLKFMALAPQKNEKAITVNREALPNSESDSINKITVAGKEIKYKIIW